MKDLPLTKLHFKVFFCFVLLSALLFFAPGCGGKKSEPAEAESDTDSLDADFDMDEEETEEDEEIEDEEENDTEADSKPDKDTDSEKADTDSDADNDSGKPTRTECRKVGGTWDESDETCYKIHDCDSKPENTTWNGWYRYTQYFEDSKWKQNLRVRITVFQVKTIFIGITVPRKQIIQPVIAESQRELSVL